MREIEIKCRLHDKAGAVTALKKLGVVLGRPKKQHDVVYGMPGAQDNALDANWLRIRTEDDRKIIFTLKRSVVGHLDSIEHETVVEDAEELSEIIKLLGYELYSDLTKIRQKGSYDDVEICVDEVPGLGSFIEAEKIMQKEAEHDEVVNELWEFFEKLGLSRKDEVHEGYDVLERKQRGL